MFNFKLVKLMPVGGNITGYNESTKVDLWLLCFPKNKRKSNRVTPQKGRVITTLIT